MADTKRTRAELLTIFADNTVGNISPQDMRDFVLSTQKHSNRIIIGPDGYGDFLTIKEAVDWLATGSNMIAETEILLDAGHHLVTDTITVNLAYAMKIRGAGFDVCFIEAATGLATKPMFSLTTNCDIMECTMDGTTLASYGTTAGENIINITGAGIYSEITNGGITGGNIGIDLTGTSSELFVFNFVITNCVAIGLQVNSTGSATIDVEVTNFENCPIGINLLKSEGNGIDGYGEFDIINSFFLQSASQTGLVYVPATYKLTSNFNSSILGNKWNGVGTALVSGFDFTRTDSRDANVYINGNIGYEDKFPHCKINVLNDANNLTITTAGTWYKAAFTNTTTYACKWTIANNRITYQPINSRDVLMWISGNVTCNLTARVVDVCVIKNNNGTPVATMSTRITVVSQPFGFSLNAYLSNVAQNDYFEIFMTSSTNGDVVKLTDLTWFARGL